GLDIPFHAHRDCLDRPGLHANRVVDRPDAEPSDRAVPIRRHRQRLLDAAAIDRDLHRLFGMTRYELPHLIVEGHRLAVDGDDHIAILEAAPSARIAGRHRCQMRVDAGTHADITELEPALPGRGRRHLEGDRLTVAKDAEIDFAIRT